MREKHDPFKDVDAVPDSRKRDGSIDWELLQRNLASHIAREKQFIVGGTGHRPDKLFVHEPYGNIALRILTGFAIEMLEKVQTQFQPIQGVISGMALGWDQALALAALELKIPLIACVPCKGQDSRWPERAQRRYAYLMRRASEILWSSRQSYTQGCMHRRDEMIVHKSELILALYDGSLDGGTAHTVNYAYRLGVRVENVWPDWEENYG